MSSILQYSSDCFFLLALFLLILTTWALLFQNLGQKVNIYDVFFSFFFGKERKTNTQWPRALVTKIKINPVIVFVAPLYHFTSILVEESEQKGRLQRDHSRLWNRWNLSREKTPGLGGQASLTENDSDSDRDSDNDSDNDLELSKSRREEGETWVSSRFTILEKQQNLGGTWYENRWHKTFSFQN